MVDTEKGPHKSQCIKSKQEAEIWELLLKGKRFCFASGQISQVRSSTEVQSGSPLFLIETNLALDRCPNLECHTWVLRTEGNAAEKEAAEMEADSEVELPLSSR